MARDHALATAIQPQCGILRFYRWNAPTLSFGRNEPARDHYDADVLAARGWGVVRRPTGGRAVLHHRELTYAIIVPVRASGGPRTLYAAVHRGIARGLRAIGVDATIVAQDQPTPAVDAGPCFGLPAPGELEVEGRKLVGSAQVRIGHGLLQHGSILVDDDQSALDVERSGPAWSDPGSVRPASLRQLLGTAPTLHVLTAALVSGLARELGGEWNEPTSPPPVATDAELRLLDRYRDTHWTWRR